MSKKIYHKISNGMRNYLHWINRENSDMADDYLDKIKEIVSANFPAGSGFNFGTYFDEKASNTNKLVFYTKYHHMNEMGFYDGVTDHKIIITPDFVYHINIKITGRDRNGIKGYIGEIFYDCLMQDS